MSARRGQDHRCAAVSHRRDVPTTLAKPRLRDYLVTPVFLVCMGIILVVFHILQVVARRVSVRWQEHMYDYLCLFLLLDLKYVARARFDVQLPEIDSHACAADLRLEPSEHVRHPARGLVSCATTVRVLSPSVNCGMACPPSRMRCGRSVTHSSIATTRGSRSRRSRNSPAIWSSPAVRPRSFPEGTRSRDGVMQPLKGAGILAILKELPQATIVPMTVDGSWQIERYRFLPVPVGIRLTLHVLPAFDAAAIPRQQLAEHIDRLIRTELERIRGNE